MTLATVRDIIAIEVHHIGNQKEAAKQWGISAPYLNDVLKGNRDPGAKILVAIGVEKRVHYDYVRTEADWTAKDAACAHDGAGPA